MKISEIKGDGKSQIHAFDVENRWLGGRRSTADLIAEIPGVKIIDYPLTFSWLREEDFCKFELNGVIFQISELYGDNSDYWIGKYPTGGWCPEIEIIANKFRDHVPIIKPPSKTYTFVEVLFKSSFYGFVTVLLIATAWRFITGSPIAI